MGHTVQLDYIKWLASMLADPRRGCGFICTEFQRRLPQRGMAVGIVTTKDASFSFSGTDFDLEMVGKTVSEEALNISDTVTVNQHGDTVVLTAPLPGMENVFRKAVMLLAHKEDKEKLLENQEVIEQVLKTLNELLSDEDTVAGEEKQEEEDSDIYDPETKKEGD